MKNISLSILLLSLASAGFCQSPKIQSMYVLEDSGWLQLRGSFGASAGSVTVEGIQLQVKGWSDTLITATIPDFGPGSAGKVIVKDAPGSMADTSLLSMYQLDGGRGRSEKHSISTNSSFSLRFFVRLDLERQVRQNIATTMDLQVGVGSYYNYDVLLTTGDYSGRIINEGKNAVLLADSGRARSFSARCKLDMSSRIFYCDATGLPAQKLFSYYVGGDPAHHPPDYYENLPDLSVAVQLDSLYIPITFVHDTSDRYELYHEGYGYSGIVMFAPPRNSVSLKYKDVLLKPGNAQGVDSENVTFAWNSLPAIDLYEIQVARDSEFNHAIYLLASTSTTISLDVPSGSTTYYWRVRGRNDAGSTAWSDVWSLNVRQPLGIATESKRADIRFTPTSLVLPGEESPTSLQLFDALGREVRQIDLGSTSTVLRYSEILPSRGVYFLKYHRGADLIVKSFSYP